MLDLKAHFSRFLGADPDRLHFAAHSHHPWPDVSRDGQVAAWDDAARLIDDKWEHVLGPVLAEAQGHVARRLALPDPTTIAFGPNTFSFLNRLLSCLPAGRPPKILATDGEFHSFARQAARLEEEGLLVVDRVAVEPMESFAERFAARAHGAFDLVWFSQVFFNSGFVVRELADIVAACGDALVVIDGYHGFMAVPTDLFRFADRAFYLAGGYKYAMAGEGACFLHCPPGFAPRPRNTGWYAAFGALAAPRGGEVAYAEDGWRFMGATFDPSGLYRLNAVMRWLERNAVTVEAIHAHAEALQARFLDNLSTARLRPADLVVPDAGRRGNFLTFEVPDAQARHRGMHAARIITDVRGTRLRFGFGVYQDEGDVDRLVARLAALAGEDAASAGLESGPGAPPFREHGSVPS